MSAQNVAFVYGGPGGKVVKVPPFEVVVVVDKRVFLLYVDQLEKEWIEATGGHLEKVEVNLEMLFADIREAINNY
jgi:hypothetical protein